CSAKVRPVYEEGTKPTLIPSLRRAAAVFSPTAATEGLPFHGTNRESASILCAKNSTPVGDVKRTQWNLPSPVRLASMSDQSSGGRNLMVSIETGSKPGALSAVASLALPLLDLVITTLRMPRAPATCAFTKPPPSLAALLRGGSQGRWRLRNPRRRPCASSRSHLRSPPCRRALSSRLTLSRSHRRARSSRRPSAGQRPVRNSTLARSPRRRSATGPSRCPCR